MQTSKRLLALLLCAVMLFTTVPVEAFATGEVPSDEPAVTEPAVEETESTGVPSETEAEAETSAPEEVTEEPTVSPEAEVTEAPVEETEEVTEPEEEAGIQAISDDDVVRVTDGEGNVTGYASLQAAFDGFAPSNNTYGGTYTVTLLADNAGNLYKNLQFPTETLNVTLDLNGHTITGDGTTYAVVINFGSKNSSGCVFTITDSVGGGVITGGKGGVKVDGKGSTFNFQGGTITGNHGASKGGGIFMGATAYLNMTGGVITGNSVTGSSSANTGLGGGVCANYATISGGAIYGNTAYAGSHLQTGRGGGVCTEITRTTGYSTLIIANGVVFGNTAGNAGDDIMAQGNGNVKFTLSIGTENWYVDGWKGTKAGSGGGQTDRYSAENPVAYTDGGFTDVKNVTVGLKYVAPTTEEPDPTEPTEPEEPQVPAAPYDNGGSDTNVADFIQFVDANGHGALLMNITGGFTAGEVVWNEELGTWTCDLTFDAAALLAVYNESYAGHRYADEIGETITVTHKWFCGEGAELSTTEGKWVPNVDGNIYKVNVTCKPLYTVTYTDGVEDEELFADQTYTVEEGEATPAFNGNPYREGYTFEGWLPEVAETVTGDATYTAQWKKIPVYVARLESTGEQFETLQAALDAAKAALTGDLDADKITMIGDTTECVKLAWSRNKGSMTLTIDLNGHTVTGNGTGSVMTFSGLTSYNGRFAIVIEDSSEAKTGTITGGSATSGGAIKMDGAKGGDSLTINGGNFTGNTATSSGGALYCAVVGATVTVNGGTFTGNTAKTGGAISAYTLVINGGTFVKNSAIGDARFTGRGGAIQVWGTGAVKLEINGGTFSGNTAARYGDDVVFCSTNNTSASMKLVELTGMKWYVDGYYGAQSGEANLSERFSEDNAVEFTDYDFSGSEAKGIAVALKLAERVLPPMPEAPDKYGKNVTEELIRVICDTDPDHAPLTIKWMHQSTKVRDWVSGVVWSDEYNAWIVPVRIDSVSVYYVWAHFEDTYNDILHDLVDEDQQCIDTYLKWDAEKELWVTLDEQPIDVHVTCKTAPTAPTTFQLKNYQIKVTGIVDGEEKVYYVYVDPNAMTIGEVKGSREEGFTVDVTVAITEDDAHQAGWIEKRDPDGTVADHEYDWSRTPATITITVKYTGNLTSNLYGDRTGDWVWVDNNKTYGTIGEAYMVTAKPAAPEQKNVVEDLVTIICDSDPERHAPVTGKWYPQHCKTTSDIVWNEELKAWTVDIRIGSLYIMYVDQLEDANNGTIHELVEDITTVYSTLVWDAEQGLWVPMEPIELHTTCRTAPIAPNYNQIDGYQIKVYGDVDDDGIYGETKPSNNGIGEVYTTSIPEGGYTLSEVYGSREEGFFVDVTVPIENGDAYITNWIANCEPGAEYLYDFEKTPATVTFTLRYNGSLTGTLYGDRHASNTNYDWVLDTNGKHFGVVGEGYVEQKTYAVQLVIYRNGNTTAPYDVIALDRMPKGTVIDLSTLDINDYYSSRLGFEFEGWFNDGAWNQYKAGKEVAGLDEITVNGWTNIICMVTDYQKVVVKAVTNGDKDNAEVIFTGKALYGENLVEWLNANVEVAERTGYTLDKWYNWDWYGHKYDSLRTVSGWTNVYVTYTADTFQIVYRNWQGTNMGTYTQTATYDEALTLIANRFKRTGYTFSHWNSKRDTNDGKFTFVDQQAITAEVVNELYNYAMANEGKAYLNVYWTANEYTVTLDANGGELETSELTVTYDAPYGELPEPTKTGYNFAGWYDENGNEVTADTIYKIAHDSTLTAQWEAATFQIVYRFWLGTNMGTYTQTATYDEGMTLIPNKFTRAGYSFDHWNSKRDTDDGKFTFADQETISAEVVNELYNYAMANEGKAYLNAYWTANEYTVSFNTNGGIEVDPITVTFGEKYGRLPSAGSVTGLSSRKNDWYLVDENGNVTDINIRNTTVVSVARDHELFLMRDVLAPSVKIALTVPGGLSDSYKYYDGNARVLTATVSNMNAEVLDYTYQWYKDGVAIEGATESVLTLEGNVSDSGTYKVVVTATLKDGSEIVVKVDTASGEKSLKVQIMRAANTLRLNENYGETPVTSDSYWGSAVATIRGGATREGYTFAGWNTAADGSGETYQVGDEIEFPGDNGNGGVVLELFAQWNAITYTIKYNGGEGAQYVGSELNSGDNWMLIKNGYTYDQPVTLNDGADFVRPGYQLVGWTVGGQAYELGQTVEKNFTKVQNGTVQAYAIWEPITYRIKYAGGEGAEYVGDLPNSKDDWVIIAGYPYGQEITLHDGTGFQRTGYTLTGWTIKGKTYELGGTAEGSFTTVQSGMITAHAVWEGNSYTLILDADGGEFVMPLAEDSDAVTTVEIPVTYGEAIGELPTPVREGYTFAGWFDAEGNEITAATVYNTDGNLTVTAKWTPNTYEVKLDSNGGKVDDDTVEVTYGEPIGELPTPTRDGYTFAGWVDADGNKVTADTIYDVADDITLVATWNVNKPADPSSPATGDGMTMFFMVSMLASAAALLFLADRKRRMA